MDTLEKTMKVKVQDLVDKLQKMDCTLLGNKDDAWIMELLFKQEVHRYHLMEWVLSKLNYDVGKISGSPNSEERMKKLQCTISDLGVCRNVDVIKGTAAIKEQLRFWCIFIDILWLKYEITLNASLTETDEGIDLLYEKKEKIVSEEFEEAYSCINKICSTINLKDLFNRNVQLLAPDTQIKIQNMSPTCPEKSKISSLEEFESRIKQKVDESKPFLNKDELFKSLLSPPNIEMNQNDVVSGFKLNQLEDELGKISADLQKIGCSSFQDAYDDIKHLIVNRKADEFTDVGLSFADVEPLMENLSQLKKSISKVVSSNSKLLTVSSELEVLKNDKTLNDENYTVLKE